MLKKQSPQHTPPPPLSIMDEGLKEALAQVDEKLRQLTITQTHATQKPVQDNAEKIQVVSEKLGIMSSKIRALRDAKPKAASPASAETELTVQEVRQTLATIKQGVTELSKGEKPIMSPLTFAQATAKPKPSQTPNHTLIISSKDPKETSDNVITKIRAALDIKKTGARVDRVRKARDQKFVIRCAPKEDMTIVKSRIQTDKHLNIREPANQNPLVCVHGVLARFANDEIEEHIKSQNKHLLHGVGEADLKMKVRYKKRARNPHECHPVLELSPEVWRRLTQAGKIYVGFGRCSVKDLSPLIQCAKCLGFGHTTKQCSATQETCSYCSGEHSGKDCPVRTKAEVPRCINCTRAKRDSSELAHTAYSPECQEKQKWDHIARSRLQYC
ncbi:uncharacterized protein LOC124542642 [Vanessa cardui]|uniref:uncharacterized protein LOC124542642 n=1 Tax=Vanessa cardui TaxID=171605 RepID=UPI001F13777D|nr:uncharacterized protein LOC124542642 [Vanessa cardui]